MTSLNATVGLAQVVEELRSTYSDMVSLDDIADIVATLMTTADGDLGATNATMQRELNELVSYVERAKQDLSAIEPQRIRDEKIPEATDELNAVVSATETATDSILDVAERLEQMANEVDADVSLKLEALATQIYEASNFQDITGQRITKVAATFQHIESKLHVLTQIVDDVEPAVDTVGVGGHDDTVDEEASLLNGPSMPEETNNQDDIDALLASFD